MIPLATAELAISVAKGVVKLAGRLDKLTAEKNAVTGDLIIPMPDQSFVVDADTAIGMLRDYVKQTKNDNPDPLGEDRAELTGLLAKKPVPDGWIAFFEKYFPAEAHPPAINPDAQYLAALKTLLPTINWDDPNNDEIKMAAFYIAAGRDGRELNYAAKVGLLVADVVAEFGAEHTALFVRDEHTQAIVQSVLTHFSSTQLEDFDEWSPFLHQALGSALNGLLDSRAVFEGHAKWADALMESLARVRDQAKNPDEYLLGLLRGQGFSRLVGDGLQFAGESIGEEHAGTVRDIVAEFLIAAAPLVRKNEDDFGAFFKDHWGDLVHGGLKAVADHGPELLAGKKPLLQKTLQALAEQLAATPNNAYFSADTAMALSEAVIAAVAHNPDALDSAVGTKWLNRLIGSITNTVCDTGLRNFFGREGLERIFQQTLTTFTQHPELIVAQPGLARDLVAQVLEAVAASDSLAAATLGEAAVSGALQALAKHPELGGTKFGTHVAELAGLLAEKVAAQELGTIHASELLDTAVTAVLRNQQLFANLEDNVAEQLVAAVLKVAGNEAAPTGELKLLAGQAVVDVTQKILVVVARHGTGFVANNGVNVLVERVTATLTAGVDRAHAELGRRLDQETLPDVLAALVARVLRGELADLNSASENFKKLFSTIADAQVLLGPR